MSNNKRGDDSIMDVSLKTIAEELSLSKATVSWILSGQGEERGFSAATIKRVREYAESVGYKPNLIARSLSMGHTKTIGLIIPAIADTYYSQIAQYVESAATEHGYMLIVGSSEGNADKERLLIQTLRSQQVAGLIIAPTNRSDRAIVSLLNARFPFVLIDRYDPKLPSNYVIVNNEESSYALVTNLFKAGCRKVAAVTTDTHLFVMSRRIAGFHKATLDCGLPIDERLFLEVDRAGYEKDVPERLEALLSEVPDVDGFFFTTHYLAEEAMRFFVKHGMDYRKRFRFACIHTTVALDILVPDMDLAIMPSEEMGRTAVEVLLKSQDQSRNFVPEEIVLEDRLILH